MPYRGKWIQLKVLKKRLFLTWLRAHSRYWTVCLLVNAYYYSKTSKIQSWFLFSSNFAVLSSLDHWQSLKSVCDFQQNRHDSQEFDLAIRVIHGTTLKIITQRTWVIRTDMLYESYINYIYSSHCQTANRETAPGFLDGIAAKLRRHVPIWSTAKPEYLGSFFNG